MKQTTTSTIVTVAKTLINWTANCWIAALSITSIASLVLLLGQFDLTNLAPKGMEMTFSGYDAWGEVNLLVVSLVAGNTLLTYGLLQLKTFVTGFTPADVFADSTVAFLKKGALLMAGVGLLEAINQFVINPNAIILNFSIAGWLFVAALVLPYIKRHFATKTA